MELYRCMHCGNVATKVYDTQIPLFCCGEEMKECEANTVDAALEKHVPVLSLDGDILTVNVGEVAHPMLPEHYITCIYIENGDNIKIAELNPKMKPEATFLVDTNQKITAYEYCNVHGLWKASLN